MKFAAIDIGSNAVRLLLAGVYERDREVLFKKETFIRVPLRLGDDAFIHQKIGKKKADSLVKTMVGFKSLMDVFDPISYMACATASLREAANSADIIDRIRREAEIHIDIIDGKREAEIIFSNHVEETLDKTQSYLYIDIGGGSTELTLFSRGQRIVSNSFNIGTIRILDKTDHASEWKRLESWIEKEVVYFTPITGIGTGGNINKIFKLSGKKDTKILNYKEMKEIYEYLKSFSYQDRIEVIGLKPDRADVILPAAELFIKIMKWVKITEIYVPQIGLSDGMIHLLYEQMKKEQKIKNK